MKELLNLGDRIAEFTLPIAGGNKTAPSNQTIGERRTMLIVVGDDSAWAKEWLRIARAQSEGLQERDVTVMIVAPNPEADSELTDLPAPAFLVLQDAHREEESRLGGAPAFYLIGKDGTIKSAQKDLPPLETLFGQIDSMPMRRQEMRASGAASTRSR